MWNLGLFCVWFHLPAAGWVSSRFPFHHRCRRLSVWTAPSLCETARNGGCSFSFPAAEQPRGSPSTSSPWQKSYESACYYHGNGDLAVSKAPPTPPHTPLYLAYLLLLLLNQKRSLFKVFGSIYTVEGKRGCCLSWVKKSSRISLNDYHSRSEQAFSEGSDTTLLDPTHHLETILKLK